MAYDSLQVQKEADHDARVGRLQWHAIFHTTAGERQLGCTVGERRREGQSGMNQCGREEEGGVELDESVFVVL